MLTPKERNGWAGLGPKTPVGVGKASALRLGPGPGALALGPDELVAFSPDLRPEALHLKPERNLHTREGGPLPEKLPHMVKIAGPSPLSELSLIHI
eukprot:7660748-Alexandrium_andersonii.AAC.1